jgi:hypothetical protein
MSIIEKERLEKISESEIFIFSGKVKTMEYRGRKVEYTERISPNRNPENSDIFPFIVEMVGRGEVYGTYLAAFGQTGKLTPETLRRNA